MKSRGIRDVSIVTQWGHFAMDGRLQDARQGQMQCGKARRHEGCGQGAAAREEIWKFPRALASGAGAVLEMWSCRLGDRACQSRVGVVDEGREEGAGEDHWEASKICETGGDGASVSCFQAGNKIEERNKEAEEEEEEIGP